MGGNTPSKPETPPPLFEDPWRPTTIRWESEQYRDELKEFALKAKPLSEMEQKWYNVLLFAPVGAGKTSFLNTIQSAFKGRISKEGETGNADRSMTLAYRIYPIRDGERRPLGFRLCDTPGIHHDDFTYSNEDFKTLIDGNVKEGCKFERSLEQGAYNTENTESKITCVCFVFNANTFEVDEHVAAFRKYQKLLTQNGVARRIIILTHIDQVCPEARYEDVKKVFHSRKIEDIVKRASNTFGIPVNEIFPIKNYECETENVLAIDILTLYILKRILDMCEDSLTHMLN